MQCYSQDYTFDWFTKTSRKPSYLAANVFGVQKEIQFAEVEEFIIEASPRIETPIFSWRIERDEAVKLKPNLRSLVIGHLASPFKTEEKFTLISPTISRPERLDKHIRRLYLDVQEIWLFDRAAGKVYFKNKF